MSTPHPRRDQTDDSLRSERSKTDEELERGRVTLEEDSDAIVARARRRADAVLEAARARADQQDAHPSAAVRGERKTADRALAEERRAESSQMEDEREARQRALAALLSGERDVTDRDLLEEREGADAAMLTRDNFLGMVSHDLRAMLGAIAVSSALQVREATDDAAGRRVIKRAESIQRATVRMSRLVGDLLDVVAIEAGQLSVHPVECDVLQLLRESAEGFSAAASALQLQLRVAPGPAAPLRARCDPERVLQVLGNLLGNALKFTRPGGSVTLAAERVGGDVRVSVTDTGEGIAADLQEAVFERFRQVDRRDRRGHGLGLHIAQSLVAAHGGRIWVESRPGSGSTFYFTLPASRA